MTTSTSAFELPSQLGLESDIERLRVFLNDWVAQCDTEVRRIVTWQLEGRAKYFRPVTVFACHRALTGEPPPERIVVTAAALELTHNVTLIVDDILDRSRYRRGKLSLHCRFGFLPALMTAGYIGFGACKLVGSDAYGVDLLAELQQRLGVAECLQWRQRRHPLGLEDWRAIAREDTGSMFEICARAGTSDDRLRAFGQLLGILYHGCDDVADVRGATALGGGSEKDIADGILTLPAAIAILDPKTAVLFRNAGRETMPALGERLRAALPEAEAYLDGIAAAAAAEARRNAAYPDGLLELIRYTRALSRA